MARLHLRRAAGLVIEQMPLDPFFTSKVSSGEEEKYRRQDYAKAVQAKVRLKFASKKTIQKALVTLSQDKSQFLSRCLYHSRFGMKTGGMGPVSGGPAQRGFKSPKKKWD